MALTIGAVMDWLRTNPRVCGLEPVQILRRYDYAQFPQPPGFVDYWRGYYDWAALVPADNGKEVLARDFYKMLERAVVLPTNDRKRRERQYTVATPLWYAEFKDQYDDTAIVGLGLDNGMVIIHVDREEPVFPDDKEMGDDHFDVEFAQRIGRP